MAETAKILSPNKTILIPDTTATCSLAESCPAKEFSEFRKKYPEAIVVSYVNTTADTKSLTDICCTSSNALDVINSIPATQPIIFAPDRNLGAWIAGQTGRTNIILWDGACHVHDNLDIQKLKELKTKHPSAPILAHPECRQNVLQLADFVGSTSAILSFATQNSATTFIIATEPGILHELSRQNPHKTFIPAAPECEYMKLVTLPKILHTLTTLSPQVTLPDSTISTAQKSISRMLAL